MWGKMPPYIYLASIGYVDLDIIVGQDELLELRKNTNSNQPTKRLNLMFPVNTAILAIASATLQPYTYSTTRRCMCAQACGILSTGDMANEDWSRCRTCGERLQSIIRVIKSGSSLD